jgi:arsenate reductase
MAEGFFRHAVGDRFEVHSGGTKPAERVHPLAIKVMAEVGIDISSQRPKQAQVFLDGRPIELLVTVCSSADSECPANLPGVKHRLHWPFDDPAEFTGTEAEVLAGFRRVRDEIRQQIETWAAGLPKSGG